jgi:hypothetical protein
MAAMERVVITFHNNHAFPSGGANDDRRLYHWAPFILIATEWGGRG